MTTPLQQAADLETTDPKVAIVTGASQGIGAGLVEAYHRRNYAVVANSRSISTSHDPGVLTIPGDIADPATAEQLVTGAIERFGHVDTLIPVKKLLTTDVDGLGAAAAIFKDCSLIVAVNVTPSSVVTANAVHYRVRHATWTS